MQLLHSSGMAEEVIKRLARWESAMLNVYLGQAPLGQLGPWSFAKSEAQRPTMTRIMNDMRGVLAKIMMKVEHAGERPGEAGNEQCIIKGASQCVVTKFAGKPHRWHRMSNIGGPNASWSTVCNFSFGLNPSVLLWPESRFEQQSLQWCEKCFKLNPAKSVCNM